MEENSTTLNSSEDMQARILPEEHNVFRNDPIYHKNLIGKKIEVELCNDSKHIGHLYCIDPVSESIILVNNSGNAFDTDIILGYTVKNITVLSNEASDNEIFQTKGRADENCDERKEKVKCWLTTNLIDVVDDGDCLNVCDDLTIIPPYTIDSCLCNNTIILERIQSLLSKMP